MQKFIKYALKMYFDYHEYITVKSSALLVVMLYILVLALVRIYMINTTEIRGKRPNT